MNKNNAKALSTLRQKIRKYNRDFESHITNYKQNPEQSADEDAEKNEEDSEGSSDEDEDDDGVSAATFLKKKSEAPSGESRKFLKKMEDEDEDSEDSEDDEDWDTGSTSSDSDSEEEEGKQTVLASRFLKRPPPQRRTRRRPRRNGRTKPRRSTIGNPSAWMRKRRTMKAGSGKGSEVECPWLRRNQKCLPREPRSPMLLSSRN